MTPEYINQTIKSCKLCPDREKTKEFGWGVRGQIMFVGQNPADSNTTGLQGTSNFDNFFLDLLKPLNLTKDDFYFTNLVKIPGNIRDFSRQTLWHCGDHVIDEYVAVDPKIIITLGKYATRYTKIESKESLFHPAAIRYGKRTAEQWQEQLKKILQRSIEYKYKK